MLRRFRNTMVVAAVLVVAGGDALAQSVQTAPKTRAAVGDSRGVIRFGTYYEDHATSSCSGYLNCFLTFSQLRSNERIQVTNLACAMTSTNVPVKLSMAGSYASSGFAGRNTAFPVTPYVYAQEIFTSTYVYYLNFNIPTNVLFGVGTAPFLNFFTRGSAAYTITMDCTITGKII